MTCFNLIVVLDNSGRVWIWGNGRTTAVQIPGLSGIRSITAGGSQVLALDWDGNIWNVSNGTAVKITEQGLYHITSISTGYSHTMAERNDGRVLAWGNNSFGELGDNTKIYSQSPVYVRGSGGAGFFNLSALTDTLYLNISSGSHYLIPLAVKNIPFTRSFTIRFDPQKLVFEGMTTDPTVWPYALLLPPHNPAQGVIAFSYYGSPATSNPTRTGLVNMLRFKAVANGNAEVQIYAHALFYD